MEDDKFIYDFDHKSSGKETTWKN